MTADDKKKMQRALSHLFVRYGGGSHYVSSLTSVKAWNIIAWILIVLGVAGWAVFLVWNLLA